MKQFLGFFVAATILWSCSGDKKQKAVDSKTNVVVDSSLVTDSAWGLITNKTDFAGLQTIFGATNVVDERVCGPECIDSIDVTKIYAGTAKEIKVYWKDSAYHKTIGMLDSYTEGSPYHTAKGLKIGSSLKDMLLLNGKKITFSGFGWDYGGYVHSYDSGSLEKSPIHFRLDLMEDSGTDLLGDIELNSDMPAVQKMLDKIKVYQLSLSFHKEEE